MEGVSLRLCRVLAPFVGRRVVRAQARAAAGLWTGGPFDGPGPAGPAQRLAPGPVCRPHPDDPAAELAMDHARPPLKDQMASPLVLERKLPFLVRGFLLVVCGILFL